MNDCPNCGTISEVTPHFDYCPLKEKSMTLYQSKYGVITQTDESTYLIGNYQIVELEKSWRLSPVQEPTSSTWLISHSDFDLLSDAVRVAIVFSREDAIGLGIRDMMYMFTTTHKNKESK